MILILTFCLGLALGAGLIWILFRARLAVQVEAMSSFRLLSQEALKDSQEQFLTLAEQRFQRLQEQAQGELGKKQQAIDSSLKPIQESLNRVDTHIRNVEKQRAEDQGDIRRLVQEMQKQNERLQHETAQLSRALRRPEVRGQWGEMQLLRTLELAGMQQGIHFTLQDSKAGQDGRQMRPDAIVHMPAGRDIIIDAKVPMDAYLDAFADGISDESRRAALERHAKQLRTHFQGLGQKRYWEQYDSPELVIMFLPDEGFLHAALQTDLALLDFGMEKRVIPASPTTLFALLKAVMYGWKQQSIAENAAEIAALGQEMHDRLGKFTEHIRKLGRQLGLAVGSYNDAVGSWESRVMPSARKFQELEAVTTDGTKEIDELTKIETMVRS